MARKNSSLWLDGTKATPAFEFEDEDDFLYSAPHIGYIIGAPPDSPFTALME